MTIGIVCTDRQTCVQHQHTAVRPWRKQASLIRRWFEARVVFLQCDINILQRLGRLARGSHGEAEPVRLADIVVWVLAENYDLDILKRCVLGPAESEPVSLSVHSLTLETENHGNHPHQCMHVLPPFTLSTFPWCPSSEIKREREEARNKSHSPSPCLKANHFNKKTHQL